MSQVKFLYLLGSYPSSTSSIDRDLIPSAEFYKISRNGNYSLFPSRRKKMTSYDGKLAILCHVIDVMTIFSYFVEMAIESALFVSVKLWFENKGKEC